MSNKKILILLFFALLLFVIPSVSAQVNTSIIKIDTPDPVITGTQLNYTIVINNSGPGIAYNLTLNETYPAGVIFDSSSPPPTVGNNVWFFPNLTNGSIITVNITVNVSAGIANGTILVNFVNLTYADFLGVNTTKNATAITVVNGPVLFVTKTSFPDPVAPGGNLTYIINITNIGNGNAVNVTVLESESNLTTIVNITPVPNATNPLTWYFSTILPNQSVIINITKIVDSDIYNGTVLFNNVTVLFGNRSANASRNTNVSPQPFLVIGKTDSPDPVLQGGQLNYTITITNTGGAAADNLVVNDSYPSGLVFNSASPAPSSGNNYWSLGILPNGSSTTINITLNVSACLPGGAQFNNTANLTYSNLVTGQNITLQATELTNCSVPTPNLVVTKTSFPDPVAPGGNLTYIINITNIGNGNAVNVTVLESESNLTTIINITPAPNATNPLTWYFSTILPNQSVIINITKIVDSDIYNGTVLFNNVTVLFGNRTTNTSRNTTVSPQPLLVISKTDSPDPVQQGSQLNYTITITNVGGAAADNIVVNESYPANLVFDSASPSPSSGNNIWNLGILANGSSTTINITLNVSACLPGGAQFNNIVNLTYANLVTGQNITLQATELTSCTVPPIPPRRGGGGGASRSAPQTGRCIDGISIIEDGVVYSPICCQLDNQYCQQYGGGSDWECMQIDGKAFGYCKHVVKSDGAPQATAHTPQEEQTPPSADEGSSAVEELQPESKPLPPVMNTEPQKKSSAPTIVAILAILAALGAGVYFVFFKK